MPGQNNLIELRHTKTGSTSKFEMFVNGVSVGAATTTTVADVAGYSTNAFNLSAGVSTASYLGSYGEIFIVKNTGKTETQVLEESTIIKTYFKKYRITA
ncbi:hypothetical protein [Rufibacter hautae]|nr:hypothetical protein [Rufibacter hautae]